MSAVTGSRPHVLQLSPIAQEATVQPGNHLRRFRACSMGRMPASEQQQEKACTKVWSTPGLVKSAGWPSAGALRASGMVSSRFGSGSCSCCAEGCSGGLGGLAVGAGRLLFSSSRLAASFSGVSCHAIQDNVMQSKTCSLTEHLCTTHAVMAKPLRLHHAILSLTKHLLSSI